jgi:antitoxin component of RelBE/YafQ-DinJ toxin-antitoxin module
MQYIVRMKTSVIPQIRVEPKLRADAEAVLAEGETLSQFVETTVRRAVEFRRMRMEFQARADAAWQSFEKTGQGRPAEQVVAALQSRLDARRRELQGKRRPATK